MMLARGAPGVPAVSAGQQKLRSGGVGGRARRVLTVGMSPRPRMEGNAESDGGYGGRMRPSTHRNAMAPSTNADASRSPSPAGRERTFMDECRGVPGMRPGMHDDRPALMQALVREAKQRSRERERQRLQQVNKRLEKRRREEGRGRGSQESGGSSLREMAVPVFVMLPLDTVQVNGELAPNLRSITRGLIALKEAGVQGVMVDIWWGIVEGAAPEVYEWGAYQELVRIIRTLGLQLQVVASFHACGQNVGDTYKVPLPKWVHDTHEAGADVFYRDRGRRINPECLSLGVDDVAVFPSQDPGRLRTGIEVYRDFMRAFRDEFAPYLGSTITELSVGMGPAGELRYPSYPEGDGRWQFPGVGEFQCYDTHMMADLKKAATAIGFPEWGNGGPHNAGVYTSWPHQTGFFGNSHPTPPETCWRSSYGEFFLSWYSGMLVRHCDKVLGAAGEVLGGTGVTIAAKIAGCHWWYNAEHAAEMAAGYYNTADRCGYTPIIKTLAKHGAKLNFTCVEMKNEEHDPASAASPEGLIAQVRQACFQEGVEFGGENALTRYDEGAFQQMLLNAYWGCASGFGEEPIAQRPMASLTFLRMGADLYQESNWRRFFAFLRALQATAQEFGTQAESASQTLDNSSNAAGKTLPTALPQLGQQFVF